VKCFRLLLLILIRYIDKILVLILILILIIERSGYFLSYF